MFWLCAILAGANLGAEGYLLASGIHNWSPIVMSGFWLLLAWNHARRSKS